MTSLGIDVGATKIKWALVTNHGQLSGFKEINTPSTPGLLQRKLLDIINAHPRIDRVGIGLPGIVDNRSNTIREMPNIPGFDGFEIGEYLTKSCNRPIKIAILNDAQSALIGEQWLGAAKDQSNVVMITLGSGIGGAVIKDGRLIRIAERLEEEIGHWPLDPDDDIACSAGVKGSVEAKIGGLSVKKRHGISLQQLAQAARRGEDQAKNHFTDLSFWFHKTLELIDERFNPDFFIVGGQAAGALDLFLDDQEPIKPVQKAKLGNQAGIIGAARKAMEQNKVD